MIKLVGITKKFPGLKKPAVDNLNLEVKEGDVCVLVGPSGCGKTTTMKMINRIHEPTSGSIFINDKDALKMNPIKLRLEIGYVIQEIGLFPHHTIEENVATVPNEKKWPKDKTKQKVDEILTLVGLDPKIYGKRYPSALSGGQRQRVGVARAMVSDPPIMLMDEPFGAVDPITRARLQNEFLRIQERISKTIVFVTHDIDEAIKMYGALRDGDVPVAMGFATDGRIAAFELVNLEDDLNFHPVYNCAPVIRKETLDAVPQIAEILNPIASALDAATMSNMNKKVDIDEQLPSEVAEEWLKAEGFIQ
jgi:ABC-type nitrate/sulfonate/bicarbonate transport system ATPase subunit